MIPKPIKLFFASRLQPEAGPVVLDRKRVYIMPDRYGTLFGLVFLVMLLAALNYDLSLGFVLTFLLGGALFVSILHTYRNLVGLKLFQGRIEPVFAGETARFPMGLDNRTGGERLAIGLAWSGKNQKEIYLDIAPGHTPFPVLTLQAPRRGWLKPPRLTVFTRFPMGLIRAWGVVTFTTPCLVYPQPEKGHVPLPPGPAGEEEGRKRHPDGDDFYGLRKYQVGDTPKQVHWKISARWQGLLTKEFAGSELPDLQFEWSALGELDTEARLSRLCRWVMDAHAGDLNYGLTLPGFNLPPGRGEAHRGEALQALALFGLDGEGGGESP
ncbi:MAG: DUF58 domain-containing protein [Magnetococcales bacterium]|nr:DUF58 domain-containing protein [Magnetococcales bacterium]